LLHKAINNNKAYRTDFTVGKLPYLKLYICDKCYAGHRHTVSRAEVWIQRPIPLSLLTSSRNRSFENYRSYTFQVFYSASPF
jgi:hypothetical protein